MRKRYCQAKVTKRGGKNGRESEHLVVPKRTGNPSQGDPAEGRGCLVKELSEGKTMGTTSPENEIENEVSTKLAWIAELARRHPESPLTTLAHHIDKDFLAEAYRRTRKNGAVGVDRETATQYAENLDERLEGLVNRLKTGTYRAPPVRRVYIPKGSGKEMRPIGVPTFEDKVLQRGVAMVLEAIYEQEFKDYSYGFRPGKSAHQALEALWKGLEIMGGGWVVDLDIKGFYDTINHGQLRSFLDQRIRDGVIRRAIDKWLKAGVMEEGAVMYSETGTPQGGVISPILANLYLHEVIDKWFEQTVVPSSTSRAFMVRYADDIVMVFKSEEDANRMMRTLPKRLEKFGLTLSPEKTKLVPFKRPGNTGTQDEKTHTKTMFDFLGFSHYWGKSRKGKQVVKRKTAKGRFAAAVKRIAIWCKINRHRKLKEQWQALCRKLTGHYNYYGITGNSEALGKMAMATRRAWFKWLCRRSQKGKMRWERFNQILSHYPLPRPIVVHSVYRCVANP